MPPAINNVFCQGKNWSTLGKPHLKPKQDFCEEDVKTVILFMFPDKKQIQTLFFKWQNKLFI